MCVEPHYGIDYHSRVLCTTFQLCEVLSFKLRNAQNMNRNAYQLELPAGHVTTCVNVLIKDLQI